jgi:hypothetical protein|tara:strand:- start:2062 stop:2586 length:525 start_codon:yes stop_codon:yes gene_type:complete
MPSIQAIADALSTVFTDERYPLGTTYVQTDDEVDSGSSGVDSTVDFTLLKGERVWMFVKAAEAIVAGELCEVDITAPYNVEPNDGNAVDPMLLAGVADHDIASGSFSWIIVRGACVVKCATGSVTAAGIALDSDGGTGQGQVEQSADAAGSIGRSLEAVSASKTNFVTAYISIP